MSDAAGRPPADEESALRLDLEDAGSRFRQRFEMPAGPDGRPLIYLCGNSLGLMPKAARALVDEEMDDWAALAVEGHFEARRPWFSYHEQFRDLGEHPHVVEDHPMVLVVRRDPGLPLSRGFEGVAVGERRDFVQIKSGPFDVDLVFAPDGIETFEEARARRVVHG